MPGLFSNGIFGIKYYLTLYFCIFTEHLALGVTLCKPLCILIPILESLSAWLAGEGLLTEENGVILHHPNQQSVQVVLQVLQLLPLALLIALQ